MVFRIHNNYHLLYLIDPGLTWRFWRLIVQYSRLVATFFFEAHYILQGLYELVILFLCLRWLILAT